VVVADGNAFVGIHNHITVGIAGVFGGYYLLSEMS